MSSSVGGDLPKVDNELVTSLRMRRRELAKVLLQTALRLLVGAVIIVLFMVFIPNEIGVGALVPVGIGIAGTVFYLWEFRRQVRSVYSAKYPAIRAIEALILSAAMFLAVFAMMYVVISAGDPKAFSERLDSFSAYYFALTTMTTVGFGDISPVSVPARSVAMVQMALDIVFIALLFRVMTGVAKKALGARQAQSGEGSEASDGTS